ncbi:MAG: hypothetical protein OEU94_01010 [Aquincola sp.]|nr:hypothetical protein [Aquincola sp.]MDH4287955.1 hypothetical protein [Aquincola sp.]MDH5328946.1 hypothetical protein [Aquincola sp.]
MERVLDGLGRWAVVVSLALGAVAAPALQMGKTPQGANFVSGGVSHEELRVLHARRDAYSLWVITAASRSGSYLADVLLTIRDSERRVVFSRRLDGPWLMIDLPLGRYQVEAVIEGQAQERTTSIHPGDHHQVFFYFDTGDEVGAEHRAPFEGNPFNGGND